MLFDTIRKSAGRADVVLLVLLALRNVVDVMLISSGSSEPAAAQT